MKYREAPDGHVIQVGDVIACYSSGARVWMKRITRVTAKRAWMRHNEHAESSAPRVYSGFRWRLGARSEGNRNISYKILLPVAGPTKETP